MVLLLKTPGLNPLDAYLNCMSKLLAITVVFLSQIGFSQSQVTFYKDIQPILLKHCSECHRQGGIGPFNLYSYEDVAKRSRMFLHVTETRYMPPWKADNTYQTYRNENVLSVADIDKIKRWITSGMAKGDVVKNLKAPVVYKKPDVSLPMTVSYKIQGNAKEDFRFFSVPTGFTKDFYARSIEFVPGHSKLVHHSRIMVDTTQKLRGIDGMSELDPRIKKYQEIPLAEEFLYGWVPGNTRIDFPPGTAKRIPKNSDFILNVHYSPSSKEATDKSVVNLYGYNARLLREVQTLTIRENHIVNQPFLLKKGEKPSFYVDYTINRDISLISIMPHMHFLGKSFLSYAITPAGEKIPLVKINDWDFNWQTTYQFKRMIRLPAFSRIIVVASYDNTSANNDNPNNPVRDVGYGWNSTDEMLNAVFYYVDYLQGDELIDY
jgi:hypothetical protein